MTHWKAWMDDDVYQKFLTTGYYSQRVASITDLFVKVISINTLSCDILNKFTFAELRDSNNQLDFLIKELLDIEKQDGRAILISHIIPQECSHPWAVRFRAVVDRFQHTIALNFFGHSHADEFKVARAYDDAGTPVGVMTVCGGITTWGGNPSLCVYDVDAVTLAPVARFTYSFDLEKANAAGKIEWIKYTDWLRDYGMPDLSPESYMNLAERIRNDAALAQAYRSRRGRSFGGSGDCDDRCRLDLYCQATTNDNYGEASCNGRQSPYDFKNDFFNALLQYIEEPWVRKIDSLPERGIQITLNQNM